MGTSTYFRDYFQLHGQILLLPYTADLIAQIIKTDTLAEFIPSSLARVLSVRLKHGVLE